jgi:acyl-CoA synthetase (AMP-forming)/AMP-acid ligase II
MELADCAEYERVAPGEGAISRWLSAMEMLADKINANDDRSTTMSEMSVEATSEDGAVEYDSVLRGNLLRVFNERDAGARTQALASLWATDGELVEPDRVVVGYGAISEAVGALLGMMPSGARFVPVGAAQGHHGLGRLNWQALNSDGQILTTGTDIAVIRGGQISRLFVVLDKGAAKAG